MPYKFKCEQLLFQATIDSFATHDLRILTSMKALSASPTITGIFATEMGNTWKQNNAVYWGKGGAAKPLSIVDRATVVAATLA